MQKNNTFTSFIWGFLTFCLIISSFFIGGLADRLFVLKPVDYLSKDLKKDFNLNNATTSANLNQTQIVKSSEEQIINSSEKASKSVVTVAIKKKQRMISMEDLFGFDFFGFQPRRPSRDLEEEEIQKDIGTGFVVAENGLVVTNKHVVSDLEAEYIVINANDEEFKVGKIYRDPTNDLAILKVEELNLSGLELGDSDDLKVGQSVIAIGTALGEFRHTVTTGVISGLGRGIEAGDMFGSREFLEGVIQTDAAINPGNSGGPLLNSKGEVIGVNVAVSANAQNIGFAIPINVVKASLDNFNATGQFDRPLLGIRYQMITEKSALLNEVPQGAYVIEVIENSSASEKLQEGDIIVEFDGQSLKNNELVKLVNKKKIGDRVKIKLWRDGEDKEISLELKGQTE